MRRHLALSVVAAVACGPNVEPPDDDEWMLGTFSNIADIEDSEDIHDRFKVVFRENGSGDYIKLGCNGNDVAGNFVWEVGDGFVRMTPPAGQDRFIDPSLDVSPFAMTLARKSSCADIGLEAYPAEVMTSASDPDLVTNREFYRSAPCSGGGSESGSLEECPPSLECHDPITCPLYWCDDQEPERCSP